jgi:hypothetical protein
MPTQNDNEINSSCPAKALNEIYITYIKNVLAQKPALEICSAYNNNMRPMISHKLKQAIVISLLSLRLFISESLNVQIPSVQDICDLSRPI